MNNWIFRYDEESHTHYICQEDGHPILLCEDDNNPIHVETLRKATATLNAVEILKHRKWGIRVTMTGWNIGNILDMLPNDGGFNDFLTAYDWSDPVTAVLEAEEWYVTNVEGKL